MLKPGDSLTVSEIVDGQALLYDDVGNKYLLDLNEDADDDWPSSHVSGCAARYGGPCTAGCQDTEEDDR